IAHCLSAPPVTMLYMPKTELAIAPRWLSNQARSAVPSNPGTGTHAITRQMPRTRSVKIIRDFSSGILKQFANVLMIARNMGLKSYNFIWLAEPLIWTLLLLWQ